MAEKKKVRSVQRSMLRRFAGPRRQTGEDYVTWIRRSTRAAEASAKSAGVGCWVKEHLKAKWSWAGHLARMSQYLRDSWAFKTTFWRDSAWKHEHAAGTILHSIRPLRSRPGRWLRWEDEVVHGFELLESGAWRVSAAGRESWNDKAGLFADARFP